MLATMSAPGFAQSLPGELDPAAARAVRKSCQADYQAYCTGENPTASSEIGCLRQHYLNLSQACRSALQGAKAKQS